jgi:hypothetical protein
MGTTLEELVVKITAENQQLIAQLAASAKATQEATSTMSDVIKKFSDESSEKTESFQRVFETMTGFVGGEVVVRAFEKAKEVAVDFFKETIGEGVNAAIATEDALQRLNTALALAGQYSRASSNDLYELASAMQQETKFGDDAVLSTAALIESLGQLDRGALKTATKSALDMASALGIDLNAAAVLVGKAATGEISSFTRYGVVIEKGRDAAETFANTLKALNEKFGGSAAAQLQTYSGQVALLRNNYEDATKQIGFAITQNQAVLNVISQVNAVVKEFGESLEANNESLKVLVGEGLSIFLTTTAGAVVVADTLARTIQTLYGIVQAATIPIGLITLGVRSMSVGFGEASKEFSDFAETARKNLTALSSDGDGKLANIATMLLEVKEAADRGTEAVKNGMTSVIEPTNSARKTVQKFTEEMQRLAEAGKETAKTLLASIEAPDQAYDAASKQLENSYKDKLGLTGDYYKELEKLETTRASAEDDALAAAHEQGKISDDQYHKALEAGDRKYHDNLAKLRKEQADAEDKVRQQTLAATGATFSNIMTLARGNSKEIFELAKTAATATAIINTYEGATKALAQGGFFGFAMAAAVITSGMVQVANIQAQKFARGGEVPGIGFSDSVVSMLTPGENVVDRSTNEMLKGFLQSYARAPADVGPRAQGQSVALEISLKDDLVEFIEMKILERQAMNISLLKRAA